MTWFLLVRGNARWTRRITSNRVSNGDPKSGSITLEHKDDLKARGEASPDLGDCLAMTFAVKIATRQKPALQNLIYSFPGEQSQRWMQ